MKRQPRSLLAIRSSLFAFRYYLAGPKDRPNSIGIAYIGEDGENDCSEAKSEERTAKSARRHLTGRCDVQQQRASKTSQADGSRGRGQWALLLRADATSAVGGTPSTVPN